MIEQTSDSNPSIITRLEKGFHDQEVSFQATRDDVNALKAAYSVVQRDMMNLTNAIDRLVARFEESRKTNWPLIATVSTLAPLLIAGIAFFMTSYTANAISPVQSEVVQMQTNMKAISDQVKDIATIQTGRGKDLSLISQTSTANQEIINRMTTTQHTLEAQVAASAVADVNSRTDRQQLNDRVQKLETLMSTEIAERRSQHAEVRVQLAEVEQQFHSVANLENLRAAQQERLNAMIWEKSHPGERYPNGTFFPTSIFQGQGGSPPINGNSTGN